MWKNQFSSNSILPRPITQYSMVEYSDSLLLIVGINKFGGILNSIMSFALCEARISFSDEIETAIIYLKIWYMIRSLIAE